MPKKSSQSFCHCPNSFTYSYSSCGGLRGFALAFDRLAKASTFVFNEIFSSSSQRSPARCRRTLCRSNL